MIKSTQMNVQDILATYSGTYLQFETRDQEGLYPAKVVSAEQTLSHINLFIERLDADVIRINLSDPYVNIKYEWPPLGMINYRNNAHFISRRAQRQWKRGLRVSQLSIRELDLFQDIPDQNHNRTIRGNVRSKLLLDAIYYTKYTPIPEAIEKVSSNEYAARAISPDFSISKHSEINKPLIVYHNTIVGTIEDNNIRVHSSLGHIKQMIQRIQNENNS